MGGSSRITVTAKRALGPVIVAIVTALIVSALVRTAPEPEVGEAVTNRIGVYVERAHARAHAAGAERQLPGWSTASELA